MLKRLGHKTGFKKKALVFILALSLLFTGLPFHLAASAEGKPEEAYVVKELEQYRNEYSKTFLMTDNTMKSIISSQPVHYKDSSSDSEWKDIDNSLILSKNKDGKNYYKNKQGNFNIQLPSQLDSNSGIIISNSGYSLSMKQLNINTSNAKRNSNKSIAKSDKKSEKQAMDELPLSSNVIYENVYNDTNIEYQVTPNGAKENIVLNKKPDKQVVYQYTVQATGLIAVKNEDSSIEFFAANDSQQNSAIFCIPAPYMFDSNNVESYDIKTDFSKTSEGYLLTYTPNIEWLKEAAHSYPVTIDPAPTVIYNAKSSYVCSASNYNNYVLGWEQQLKVGPDIGLTGTHKTFIKFEGLPTSIPAGYYISNATINLWQKEGHDNTKLEIDAYEVHGSWNENGTNGITYNNQPDWEKDSLDTQYITGNEIGYHNWEITSTVKDWINNVDVNNGIMLSAADTGASYYAGFYSTRYANINYRPYLVINYLANNQEATSFPTAVKISNPDNTSGTIGGFSSVGETDYYRFRPTHAGVYNIYTTSNSFDVDTVGTLYNHSNIEIAHNDDPNGTLGDFQMNKYLAANEEFLIKITNAMTTGTGAYTLFIKEEGISDGAVYYLRNKKSGKFLDVMGGVDAEGRTVQQYDFNGSPAQKWKAVNVKDGKFRFQAMNTTNKYLEVESDSSDNEIAVNIRSKNANTTNNTLWQLTYNSSNDTYSLFSDVSGYMKCATVQNASMNSGAIVFQFDYNASHNDEWEFIKAFNENDVYQIKNVQSERYMDVYNFGLDENDPVCDWSESNESNQLWRIECQNNGYFKFYSLHTNNKVLGINSNNIVSVNDSSSDNVLWKIVFPDSTSCKIISKISSNYVTVDHGILNWDLKGKSDDGEKSQWKITKFNNDTYWDNKYNSVVDLKNVYYTVDTSAITSDVTVAMYQEAIGRWNNISSNVNLVYVPQGEASGRKRIVTFVNSIIDRQKNVLGVTLGTVNGAVPDDFTSKNWDETVIYLDLDYMSLLGYTTTPIEQTITHEFGHALKLSHPSEIDEDTNTDRQPEYKNTFPALMQPMSDPSVDGVNYNNARDKIQAFVPTTFDKSALRAKWGE